ncbi:hypothetical protein RD055328_08550 [Companilactobacillus sp. RD055328]|uniref:hypothetical protein n=1 Tax=Companilactobacillus sp. RD055328 TaxID=2916634 RepID=UPI001FC81784|nr:hypothetical protein [Companilactobacillus sp. RD055328]GKQ42932.1 hypothetical protein RD055328_08550 [Companilactobacillus sp. RD055328]
MIKEVLESILEEIEEINTPKQMIAADNSNKPLVISNYNGYSDGLTKACSIIEKYKKEWADD